MYFNNSKKFILIFLFINFTIFCETKIYDITEGLKNLRKLRSDDIFKVSSKLNTKLSPSHNMVFDSEEINRFSFLIKFRYHLPKEYKNVLFSLRLYSENTYLGFELKYPEKVFYFCFGTRDICKYFSASTPEIFDGEIHSILLKYNIGNIITNIDCKNRQNFTHSYKSFQMGSEPIDMYIKFEASDNISMDILDIKFYSGKDTADCHENNLYINQIQPENGERGSKGKPGNMGLSGNRGPPGIVGLQGQPGLRGYKGQDGLRGPKGETGSPGSNVILESPINHFEAGLIGDKGMKGIQGEKGFTGVLSVQNIKKSELKELILEVFEEFLVSGLDRNNDNTDEVLVIR